MVPSVMHGVRKQFETIANIQKHGKDDCIDDNFVTRLSRGYDI